MGQRERLCVRVNAHPSHRSSAEMKRRSTPYTKDHEFLKSLLAMDPLDPKDPPPSAPIFNPVPPESELFDLIQMVRPSHAMHKLSCPLALGFRYVFASRIASGSLLPAPARCCIHHSKWFHFLGAQSQAYQDSIEASKADRAASSAADPAPKKKK